MTRREPQAHRPVDLSRGPQVTADDFRALFWLIAVVLIVLALTAVPPEWLGMAQ